MNNIESLPIQLSNYANAYVSLGFSPLLVGGNDKIPVEKYWQNSKASSSDAVTKFANHRGNIGVTFTPEFFAIDLDVKGDGIGSLERLAEPFGGLPVTLTQRTPSGGEHRIYRKPASVILTNKVRILSGVDIRTTGGQIVVEPSTINGKAYQWLDWDVTSGEAPIIADSPTWLLDFLSAMQPALIQSTDNGSIKEGGRNDTLTRLAGAMRRHGCEQVVIENALKNHNATHCTPPLSDKEVRTIAHSVSRYAPEPLTSDLASLYGSNVGEHQDDVVFSLDAFSINDSADEMEWNMLADKFVLGCLAILGQSTIWYAPPNVGKTLLFLWLLIQAIKSGDINPEDVFYIDADDHHKGLIQKAILGKKYGFKVLAPGYKDFKPEQLALMLAAMVLQETAHGKILILDTAKKFTDIMDKKKGTEFGKSVRQFVMHGGTVISLAHTNKHRDEAGGLIYSGTSDLVDDCDAAYTLDVVTTDKVSKLKTVKFTNFKARGDNALEAVYQYDFSEGISYQQRLDSVRALGEDEKKAAEKHKAMDAMLERNQEAINAIKDAIRNGVTKKTELIKAAMEISLLSKTTVARALKDHTGLSLAENQFWHVNIEDKNAHVYQLNPYV